MRPLKWHFFLIFIVVGTLIYSNTFNSSFHYDDRLYIVENPAIKNISNVKTIWEFFSTPSRFVAVYSFALQHHFHGLNVFGYHLVNLIIHLINTFLVWWFAHLLFISPKGKELSIVRHKEMIAFCAALLFLTHPIQTQAVTYITQRFASLATMFYLLSLCFYAKARASQKGLFYFFCCLSALLGVFTKEIIITLPLMIFFYEFAFISGFKMNKGIRKKVFLVCFVLLSFACIIPSFHSFNVVNFLTVKVESGSHQGDVLTPMIYLLTQFRVLWTYIRLLFLPVNQNLDYDFPVSESFFEPKTLVGFLALLMIFSGACVLFKRNRIVAFGILWFFITSSVESSAIVIRNVIFEHRVYLPSVGFFIALSTALFCLFKDKRGALSLICILGVILGILTFQRNKIWYNDVTLWEDVAKKSPNKARAHHNLGVAYMQSGEFEKALIKFNKAIELNPEFEEAYNYRGNYFAAMRQFDSAVADYQHALIINPYYVDPYYNIGLLYHKQGRDNKAVDYYSKAIALNPNHLRALNNRGVIYMRLKNYQSALDDFNRIIERYPHVALTYRHRAQVFKELKQYEKARDDLSKAENLK